MKTLKFDHAISKAISKGEKTSTWRMYDDKDLSVNDTFSVIDKVNPNDPSTWRVAGNATITQIVEKNLGSITKEDMEGHEEFASTEEMLAKYQNYYGGRVTLDTPIKMISFSFTASNDEVATPGMLLEFAKIYTDGGSRGNPGHSAAAYVIMDAADNIIEQTGQYIGVATNNQAEYAAFDRALKRARELGIDKIELYSDSQLVVNQLNGIYKVKNPELAPYYRDVKALADSFKKIIFTHVPREQNKIADALVNEALDQNNN
jgi:ribonuclease HI